MILMTIAIQMSKTTTAGNSLRRIAYPINIEKMINNENKVPNESVGVVKKRIAAININTKTNMRIFP